MGLMRRSRSLREAFSSDHAKKGPTKHTPHSAGPEPVSKHHFDMNTSRIDLHGDDTDDNEDDDDDDTQVFHRPSRIQRPHVPLQLQVDPPTAMPSHLPPKPPVIKSYINKPQPMQLATNSFVFAFPSPSKSLSHKPTPEPSPIDSPAELIGFALGSPGLMVPKTIRHSSSPPPTPPPKSLVIQPRSDQISRKPSPVKANVQQKYTPLVVAPVQRHIPIVISPSAGGAAIDPSPSTIGVARKEQAATRTTPKQVDDATSVVAERAQAPAPKVHMPMSIAAQARPSSPKRSLQKTAITSKTNPVDRVRTSSLPTSTPPVRQDVSTVLQSPKSPPSSLRRAASTRVSPLDQQRSEQPQANTTRRTSAARASVALPEVEGMKMLLDQRRNKISGKSSTPRFWRKSSAKTSGASAATGTGQSALARQESAVSIDSLSEVSSEEGPQFPFTGTQRVDVSKMLKDRRTELDRQQSLKTRKRSPSKPNVPPGLPPKDSALTGQPSGRSNPADANAGGMLDVQIPRSAFDRFSIMFEKQLSPLPAPPQQEGPSPSSAKNDEQPAPPSPVHEQQEQAWKPLSVAPTDWSPTGGSKPEKDKGEILRRADSTTGRKPTDLEARKQAHMEALSSHPIGDIIRSHSQRMTKAATAQRAATSVGTSTTQSRKKPEAPLQPTRSEQQASGRSETRKESSASSDESLPATPRSSDTYGYVVVNDGSPLMSSSRHKDSPDQKHHVTFETFVSASTPPSPSAASITSTARPGPVAGDLETAGTEAMLATSKRRAASSALNAKSVTLTRPSLVLARSATGSLSSRSDGGTKSASELAGGRPVKQPVRPRIIDTSTHMCRKSNVAVVEE